MLNNAKLRHALEMSVNDMNSAYDENKPFHHHFSRRYNRRKRAIITAYKQSLQSSQEFEIRYKKVSFRQRVLLAIIIAVTAVLLTGSSLIAIYYIGGIRAEQQSTHTDAFAADWESAPLTLKRTYRITYDMSGYKKEIVCDDEFEYWEDYTYEDYYVDYIMTTKEMFQNSRLNTEDAKIEIRKVGYYEALYFVRNSGTQCLVWDNGEYIFELQFNIDYDTALTIAQSIIPA